jgi:serine protease Do
MRAFKRYTGPVLLALVFVLTGSPVPAAFGGIYADAKNPVVQIVKAVSPAVVNIDVETMSKSSTLPLPFRNDPFFREFFGEEFRKFSRSVPMKGRGSGFIVSKDGQILTNNHVVEGVDKITVTLVDGKTYEATVLGRDPTYDLAVISIKPDGNLPVLELGDSDAIDVGEWAIAIGNPYGLEHTVTVGVISAKNRSLHTQEVNFDGFLQTDAAINPGNSGGPLLNMDGRVIGINTAIVPYAQGLGFAVPVNMAKQIMNDLVSYGKVRRGWLGIAVQNLTKEFAEAYNVDSETGVIVGDVFPDSAAAKAGLRRGDVIVEVNGNAVKDMQSFVNTVRSQAPGAQMKLRVVRDGKKVSITAKLDEIPEAEGGVASSPNEEKPREDSLADVGIGVSPLTTELRRQYRIETRTGLVVTDVAADSPAQSAGIREGDLLLEVNGKKVADLKQLDGALGKGKSIVLLIERDGRTFFTSLKLEDKK